MRRALTSVLISSIIRTIRRGCCAFFATDYSPSIYRRHNVSADEVTTILGGLSVLQDRDGNLKGARLMRSIPKSRETLEKELHELAGYEARLVVERDKRNENLRNLRRDIRHLRKRIAEMGGEAND